MVKLFIRKSASKFLAVGLMHLLKPLLESEQSLNVIDRCPRPQSLLEKLRDGLNPGGRLVVVKTKCRLSCLPAKSTSLGVHGKQE